MATESHKKLLKVINTVKEKVKESDVYRDMCKKHGVDVDYIDLVPMAFEDLEVSARTNKGCIYFNHALLEDGDFEKEDHYMIHEMVHHFQQCFGDGPTEGSTKDSYLDNEYEQEGFQAQTEYLSETRDDETAKKYVDKVMDHHDVPKKEREKRRSDLLNLAVEIYSKKKEAGLFKVPKAWTDKLEKIALGHYASQMWRRALELIDEGAGKKRPDGSVEQLGNDALLDLYHDEGSDYHEFLQSLSASKDEWKAKMVDLPSGKITDEMRDKIRGLSYKDGDHRGRWEREVSKEEQGEFLLKLLSESSLSESQVESIKKDLEQSSYGGYPENIVSSASTFKVEPVEFAMFHLPDNLAFSLSVTRKEEDLYEVGAYFPSDEMGQDVHESVNKADFPDANKKWSLQNNSFLAAGVDFEGNLEDAAEFAVWLGHNVLMDSYVPYFTDQMDRTFEMGKHGLMDLMFVIKKCSQYASGPAEKEVEQVDMHMELWSIVHDLKAVSEYLDNVDMDRFGEIFYKGLIGSGWPERIPVKIFLETDVKFEHAGEKRESGGLWQPGPKTVSISFDLKPGEASLGNDVFPKFKRSIEHGKDTIRHELQHMAQTILKDINSLSEEFGLTSRKIRDPQESIHGVWRGEGPPETKDWQTKHQLRDIEFYTDLTDAVSAFNREAGNWPADLKREYAKLFVGEPNNLAELIVNRRYSPDQQSEMSDRDLFYTKETALWGKDTSWFFYELRQRDIPRWQIAVREFMKATQ